MVARQKQNGGSAANTASRPRAHADAVAAAVDKLRSMLISSELLPGQIIRQEALAEQLGMSRVPVRQALGMLANEGVLDHRQNAGYSVKRLTRDELDQAYLIRRVIERELVPAIPALSADEIAELRAINTRLEEATARNDVVLLSELNRELHFRIYDASRKTLLVEELTRMWNLTAAYRSIYLYTPDAQQRMVSEHWAIIDALEAHDLERLIALLDEHRSGVPEHVSVFLSASPRS
ncbi:GntR family transcriptional regulator [Microbacterium sp. RD1]|uniref:GntR family transcriptional regulator n=1 Tax=Microbacterium sp. RD1 TaxID=3457313 RepID=UPI003FA538CF